MKYLVILILVACGPRYGYVTQTEPWKVQITAPIPQNALTTVVCHLEKLPERPELVKMLYEDTDVMSRVAVHLRDFNAHIQYSRDLAVWANQMDLCLRQLVKVNAPVLEIKPRIP